MSRRPLDQTVQQEIAAVLASPPHNISIDTFCKLEGGYANLVYEINGSYILRVFFRDGWKANFSNEQHALAMLSEVPNVPHVVSSGVLPLEWPCPYLLLTKLPGDNAFTAWTQFSADIQSAWAESIVSILRRIHALPLNHYGPLQPTNEPASEISSWQTYYENRIVNLFMKVRSCSLPKRMQHLIDQAEEYYQTYRHVLAFQIGPRLVHGDVRLHNVIIDGTRVAGLIDWEWAHGGEPEEDLVNLVRFGLFPDHEVEGAKLQATRTEYAPLLSQFLSAYPAIAAIPDLSIRLTLYLIQADLSQLCIPSESIQHNAEIRLHEWLHGNLIQEWIDRNFSPLL